MRKKCLIALTLSDAFPRSEVNQLLCLTAEMELPAIQPFRPIKQEHCLYGTNGNELHSLYALSRILLVKTLRLYFFQIKHFHKRSKVYITRKGPQTLMKEVIRHERERESRLSL